MKFETSAIHVGEEPNVKEGGYGDVVIPIHLSTTFARKSVGTPTQGYEYSRTRNPTRDALEARMAKLENAKHALAFSSGMAAEATLLLGLLKSGDHVVAFDDLYGGTKRLFNRILREHLDIQFTFVDARKTEEVQKKIRTDTKLIWLETPTNPLLKLCDIKEISQIAKEHQIITVVDNTFMSPYLQNPLDLGADLVIHSSTKYINGHSDCIGGVIMMNSATYHKKIQFAQNAIGAILSPFDSYLVLRGSKTLAIRMKQHQQNATQLSQYLENHPKVARVYYPGLASHPDHLLAKRQMKGFGGMISFELDRDLESTTKFVESLKYFAIAESLGGVESLIEIPSVMTHASLTEMERKHIGLNDSLIRVSVGIEHIDDLLSDMEEALKGI